MRDFIDFNEEEKSLCKKIMRRVILNENDCWICSWCKAKNCYPTVRLPGFPGNKNYKCHIYMLKMFKGEAPEGKPLALHTCDVKKCCSPFHTYWGDYVDNSQDTLARGQHVNKHKTHCSQGHEYTEENTYILQRKNGSTARDCVICANRRAAERRERTTPEERKAYKAEYWQKNKEWIMAERRAKKKASEEASV